ncbi:MAG: anti-sigma factor antagonist [Planctomycetota bacterium]|nr:MAG: anti-sigma factor antagonist [Planctomycetota bacterium]
MSDAGYLVARSERSVYVRAQGMANMVNAPTLDAFLVAQLEAGLDLACVDLSECTGMDSTFMGTLVGFQHRMSAIGGRFLIVNPSKGNAKLLDMLGVSEVVPVLVGHVVPDLDFLRLEAGALMSPLERALLMKRAHESLVNLSEVNREKFAPFLSALEADVQRRVAQRDERDGKDDRKS